MAFCGVVILAVLYHDVIVSGESYTAHDLMIQPAMDSITRPLRGALIFTCTAMGMSPDVDPNLKWFDNEDQWIEETTGRRYIEFDGLMNLKLYITSIENEDSGTYTCRGDIEGNTLESTIRLDIFKDITFDHAPSPQHPRIYSQALIECEVSGQPSPTVSWRFKNKKITTGGRYIVGQKGLEIMNITRDGDSGEYQCIGEVTAEGRYAERLIFVDVHIPPTIREGPGEVQGVEGNEVAITCEADGLPPPKYDFYKDGNQNPMASTARIQVDRDLGAVHFRPAIKADEGTYKCEANNDVGTAEMDGRLTVLAGGVNTGAVGAPHTTTLCQTPLLIILLLVSLCAQGIVGYSS